MPDEGVSQLKLRLLLARAFADSVGSLTATLVTIGESLGFFTELAVEEPVRSDTLAQKAGTDPDFTSLWLETMVLSQYVTREGDGYHLDPEQRALFEANGGALAGSFSFANGLAQSIAAIEGWARDGAPRIEHAENVSSGLRRMSRAKIERWLDQWLNIGSSFRARIAAGDPCVELGCGSGEMLRALVARYTEGRFFGVDEHAPTLIRRGWSGMCAAGLIESLRNIDLIISFESLHHAASARNMIREAARLIGDRDGAWMIIEPLQTPPAEELLTRHLWAVSTLFCHPDAPGNGLGRGAVVDAERLQTMLEEEGLVVSEQGETEQHFVLVASSK